MRPSEQAEPHEETGGSATPHPGEEASADAPEMLAVAPGDSDDAPSERVEITVESRAHGWRLDHYLHRLFPNHSRAHLQRAIEAGGVLLNGLVPKTSRRLRVNDRISVELPESDQSRIVPEDLPLDVLYEDHALVVVNKPAGMIVHPGRGHSSGTLAAALQFHFDRLSDVAGRHRPGIVHRLDRDTTGVIVIARDNQVHQKLSGQFERREVRKEYVAIVRGVPELASDYIRTHVCPNPRIREKMMVCPESTHSREAVTFYETAESFGAFALMNLFPRTGRTHQLRVHMQHLGTPIVADAMYAGQNRLTTQDVRETISRLPAERTRGHHMHRAATPITDQHLHLPQTADGPVSGSSVEQVLIARQALHAARLQFRHPADGRELQFEAPLPDDFLRTLEFLRACRRTR